MKTIEEAFKTDKNAEKVLNMKIASFLCVISPMLALGFVCVKEWRDYNCPFSNFCKSDLVYSAIGMIFGSGVHILILAMFL